MVFCLVAIYRLHQGLGEFQSKETDTITRTSTDGITKNHTLALLPNNQIAKTSINRSWRPTDEWIENCVTLVQSNKSEVVPFLETSFSGYRLGDCIKLCIKCHYHKTENPNNFALQYGRESCKGGNKSLKNLTLVRDILQRADGKFPKPAEDEIVLHLRLGDVVENNKRNTVQEMLKNGADPNYGGNYRWFHNSIKSIHEYLTNIEDSKFKKVSIRGGTLSPNLYKKSRVYAGCLKRAVEQAGYDVSIELDNGNPDEDFYYMSHAKAMVVSTGGYSKFIGQLVELGGGEIYGRIF